MASTAKTGPAPSPSTVRSWPATVLNSARAVEMSVYVVRAFVRMREVISQSKEIHKRLAELEQRIDHQDGTIVEIVRAIRRLTATPQPAPDKPTRKIGFV